MLTDRALTPTTFIAGADEDLIIADVYTKKDDSVLNKIAPVPIKSNSLGGGVVDNFRGKLGGALSKLGGGSGLAQKALAKYGPSVMARITSNSTISGIPGLSSSLTNVLSSATRDGPGGLSKALTTALPSIAGTLTTSGGLTSRIAPGQISSMYQMSGLINNITGTNTVNVVDKDSSSRLVGSLATLAMQSGIPKPFTSVMSVAGVDNKNILISAGISMLSAVKNAGNIGALKDIATVIGGSNVRLGGGNILAGVAQNYGLPPNATSTQVKDEYEFTRDAFNSVNPDWNTSTQRVITTGPNGLPVLDGSGNNTYHDETSLDLTTIQGGSPDFLAMIERGSKNSSVPAEKFWGLAGAFPMCTPEDSLRNTFPMTASSVVSQSTPNVTTVFGKESEQIAASSGIDNADLMAAHEEKLRLNRLAQAQKRAAVMA